MSDQATPEAAPAADDLGAALMLHENGRFPDAVLCYRRALSREPENTLGRYLLGLALMASGDTNGARAEWEAVSRCSATEGQAAWALGRAQALLERVDVPSARQD